jgi:hypothetical protein
LQVGCYYRAMSCAECAAFIAAYNIAVEHYAVTAAALHKMADKGQFMKPKYQELKAEAEQARDACEMAKAALRIHREEHQWS